MGRRDIERAARRVGVAVEAEWGTTVNAFSGEWMWDVAVKRGERVLDRFAAFSSAEVVETLETTDWSDTGEGSAS